MASRILSPASQMLRAPAMGAARGFSMSARRAAQITETPLPVRKPVGAFRGGLTGFLLGSTLAGAGVYYYILEEYKVSNELLTEDIYVSSISFGSSLLELEGMILRAGRRREEGGGRREDPTIRSGLDENKANQGMIQSLQNSVQRVHTYVQSLEEKLADLEKKKK
ncbi:hypothetical protein ACHAQE_002656 [Botrytis cinerea]